MALILNKDNPLETKVRLSNGNAAKIIDANIRRWHRPAERFVDDALAVKVNEASSGLGADQVLCFGRDGVCVDARDLRLENVPEPPKPVECWVVFVGHVYTNWAPRVGKYILDSLEHVKVYTERWRVEEPSSKILAVFHITGKEGDGLDFIKDIEA